MGAYRTHEADLLKALAEAVQQALVSATALQRYSLGLDGMWGQRGTYYEPTLRENDTGDLVKWADVEACLLAAQQEIEQLRNCAPHADPNGLVQRQWQTIWTLTDKVEQAEADRAALHAEIKRALAEFDDGELSTAGLVEFLEKLVAARAAIPGDPIQP